MQTVVEQILARIKQVLLDAAIVQTVERGREDAYGADELPAINIRRLPTKSDALALAINEITLDFDLEIAVDDGGETKADEIHAQAHALLSEDAALSSLTNSTLFSTGTEGAGDGADRDLYRLAAHYEIRTWVSQGDLTQPA